MNDLFSLQNEFQNYLLAEQSDLHKRIAETATVSTEKRLSIYYDAYRFRLLDALGENFPVLLRYLGFDRFSDLGKDYINLYPSSYRSIRWYGETFSAYLRENAAPYLAELAEFEWKMALSFDAADETPIDIAEMTAIPAESWPLLRFVPHPSLQLMHFNWNVVAIWEAIKNEKEPSRPSLDQSRLWVLWRHAYINRFYSPNTDESWTLEALIGGLSFAELCEGLCKWHKEEEVGIRAASLLKGWIQSGFIVNILI